MNIPRLIAHRGAPKYSPENTLASLRKACELGARWVECDTLLTADKQPVIIHDETVNRTTNGKGRVNSYTLDELLILDAGNGETVPTLKAWIQECIALGMSLNLEVKEQQDVSLMAELIQQHFELYWTKPELPYLISSNCFAFLEAYYQLDKITPLAFVVNDLPNDWKQQLERINANVLVINHQHLNQNIIAQLHQHGISVLAYTVNDSTTAKTLFSIGVGSIFSDVPDILER